MERINLTQESTERRLDPGSLIGEGITAPIINDAEEFEFDWPSEEIKQACKELFPGNKQWTIPALNWIPPEQKRSDEEDNDSMQDISYNAD